MKTSFYFQDIKQAEQFAHKLRRCHILCDQTSYVVEVTNFRHFSDSKKTQVFEITKCYSTYFHCDYQEREKLDEMTMLDCIELWNKRATDMYHQLSFIKLMEDEKWWNHLSSKLGAWDLMHYVWNSGEDFNDSDKYFGYIEDNCTFFSFSTKQELLEKIGEDFFLDNLLNE